MADAILSRGATSVTFRLWQEAGDVVVARDVGKPQLAFKTVSRQAPRSQDQLSSVDQPTLLGVFVGDGAYSRANAIVENLILPYSDGTPLQLDITDVEGFDSVFEVGVPSEDAIQLDYQPGRKDRVDVQLSTPIVSSTVG